MTDRTESLSGSERLGGFLGRLHPATRILGLISFVNFTATAALVLNGLLNPPVVYAEMPFLLQAAEHLRSLTYSLEFFGTAAMVEFLVRIWSELKLARGVK